MKLEDVLKNVRPIIPLGPPLQVVDEIIKSSVPSGVGLEKAYELYVKACGRTDHTLSDYSYWAALGGEIRLEAVVNLLRAAEKTGKDNLPDVEKPNLKGVVMDAQHALRQWGKQVALKAGATPVERPPLKKIPGCPCVSCFAHRRGRFV